MLSFISTPKRNPRIYWRLDFSSRPKIIPVNGYGSNFLVFDADSKTAVILDFSVTPPPVVETIPIQFTSVNSILGPVLIGKGLKNEDVFWHLAKSQLLLKIKDIGFNFRQKYCNYMPTDGSLVCRVSPPPENRFKKLSFQSNPSVASKFKVEEIYFNFEGQKLTEVAKDSYVGLFSDKVNTYI